MGDFSQSPLDLLLANQLKGYVGVHIEQGVPVLDRDLNLLHDLIAATTRAVVARYIGNGVPADADGFAIQAQQDGSNIQDFVIGAGASGPGTFLVGGLEVTIPAATTYKAQPEVPALLTPNDTQPDPRFDLVYLDVSLAEVDGSVDPDLGNSLDVGVQTSVRQKPTWVVRVAEGRQVPTPPVGHTFVTLAQLRRPRGVDQIDATMITDRRQRRLTVADLEQRMSQMERLRLLPSFSDAGNDFLPRSGPVGSEVTLTGRNFDLAPEVRFNDTPVPPGNLTQITATTIKLTVPTGLAVGPYQITVTTTGGSATTGNFGVRL